MRQGECNLRCEMCYAPAVLAELIPDAAIQGYTPSEAGYRLKPLCWLHSMERRQVATSRMHELLRCDSQNLARVDRGRWGGDVFLRYVWREAV